MKLPQNIKTKPSLPSFFQKNAMLPMLFDQTAQGIFGSIYLPKSIMHNLQSSNPSPYNIALLIHEQTHIKRQKKEGFIWYLKFIFNAQFRLHEEILARKEQMRYLKKKRFDYPFDQQARFLSSWLYLWPEKYETIRQELKKCWEGV